MRVIIISNTPWRDDNSFGNSFSNIFGGIENIEIANIYCRYGEPSNQIVKRYFQITEKSILKNIKNCKYPSGKEVSCSNAGDKETLNTTQSDLSKKEWEYVNKIRITRFQIFFWIRDLIWETKRWKSKELENFIDSFKPDLIFAPIYYSTYLNDICMFVKNYSKKKMVGYISDDNYTLKQFSLSPLYWIDRLIKRPHVKRTIMNCEYIYTITELQKQEYGRIFKKECRLLWKGGDFSKNPNKVNERQGPVSIVFMGNIGYNRWKSLAEIVVVLKNFKEEGISVYFKIYTLSPRNRKIEEALNVEGVSSIMPVAAAEEVSEIQRNADILVHVEPVSLKDRLLYRLSFSTKIVDYFANAQCILAYGGYTGTMDYLKRHDAAVVVESHRNLATKLRQIVNDYDLRQTYAKKAWECGKLNHEISHIQERLYKDLFNIVNQK